MDGEPATCGFLGRGAGWAVLDSADVADSVMQRILPRFVMMVLDKLAVQTITPADMSVPEIAGVSFRSHQRTGPRYTGLQKPSRTTTLITEQALLQGTDPVVAAYIAAQRG